MCGAVHVYPQEVDVKMEAVCMHDFTATATDELTFRRNETIKILDMDEDQNWYRAELSGQSGYVPSNYIKLKDAAWYLGGITRVEAERKLIEGAQPDGAFLVRRSESSPGEFSISVKFQDGVQHFKILRDGAGKYFIWVMKFASLNELVEHHRSKSVSRTQTIYLRNISDTPEVQVLFDFEPQDPEEITLKRGDRIRLLEKVDNNWWRGEKNGTKGLFPATYVKEVL